MQSLIVLGASVRAAADSAIRGGFAAYGIDLFADRDLAAVCPAVKIQRYPGEFLSALAAAPDAPWIYTGGLENHPRLVNRLAKIRPLWGNRGEILREVRGPERLAAVASDAGCCFPRLGAGPTTLVKPRRSGGGLGIRFAAAADLAKPPRGSYLQEYIAGEAASAIYVAAGGQAVLRGATRQLLGRDFSLPRPFLYVGSIGPLMLRAEETKQLTALGERLAERFGLVGLFNVDFVRSNDGVCPLEINPRYSASIEVLERATNVRFMELHASACRRNPLAAGQSSAGSRYSGKAIVYADHNGIVPPELDEIASAWNNRGGSPGLGDIPRVGEALRAGQPVATALADGDSPAAVEQSLRGRVAALQQMLKA